MTSDDIIRMAREADLLVTTSIPDDSVYLDDLERFAALVAAAEREACAKLFDGKVWSYDYREIATAIRARGEEMNDTKTMYDADTRIHVVPLNDLREHTTRPDCWCKPTEDDEWPDVWVHHSMDEREQFEQGRENT